MNRPFTRFISSLFLVVALTGTAWGKDVYRIVYEDDDSLKDIPRALLEKAYGTKLYILPKSDEAKPKRPAHVKGVVIHTDTDDAAYVVGTENPALNSQSREETFSDKLVEYQILSGIFAKNPKSELTAPLTVLAKEFVQSRDTLDDLEAIRQRIEKKMGKSILKLIDGFHSEGRLPKTNKNWKVLYDNYVKYTKAEVEKIEADLEKLRRTEGSTESLQNLIFDKPFIEGRLLETLIAHPDQVIAQKMIDIEKEIRVHAVMGKVLKGATFLRTYHLGGYLTPQEIERAESVMQDSFLDQLPKKLRPFTSATDLAVERGTGKIFLLDLNPGWQSGYFFPNEDLHTTNKLAQVFTDYTPPFLEEFANFEKLPLTPEKAQRLAQLTKEYEYFIDGDDPEAFWTNVVRNYLPLLKKEASAAAFDTLLTHLKKAGLEVPSIFYAAISEIQDTYPSLALTPDRLTYWIRTLNALDDTVKFSVEGNKIKAREQEEEQKEKQRKTKSKKMT